MRHKLNNKYGLAGVFSLYGAKRLLKDLMIPAILALLTCAACMIYINDELADNDIFLILTNILDLSLTILPIVITLLLTAFTMFITVFNTNKQMVASKALNKTILSITSTYAGALIVSIIALGILFTLYVVASMRIHSDYSYTLNILALFLSVLSLTYPFTALIQIVIDLFNSGRLSLRIATMSVEQLSEL